MLQCTISCTKGELSYSRSLTGSHSRRFVGVVFLVIFLFFCVGCCIAQPQPRRLYQGCYLSPYHGTETWVQICTFGDLAWLHRSKNLKPHKVNTLGVGTLRLWMLRVLQFRCQLSRWLGNQFRCNFEYLKCILIAYELLKDQFSWPIVVI